MLNDKDVEDLIEHFRDKDRRKEFFKEFKELEVLYEIISPDAFRNKWAQRPVVAKAARRVQVLKKK